MADTTPDTPTATPTASPTDTPADGLTAIMDGIEAAANTGEPSTVYVYRLTASGREPTAQMPGPEFDPFSIGSAYGSGRYFVRAKVGGRWIGSATFPALAPGSKPAAALTAPQAAAPVLDAGGLLAMLMQQANQHAQQQQALLLAMLQRDAVPPYVVEMLKDRGGAADFAKAVAMARRVMEPEPAAEAPPADASAEWARLVRELAPPVLSALKAPPPQAPAPRPAAVRPAPTLPPPAPIEPPEPAEEPEPIEEPEPNGAETIIRAAAAMLAAGIEPATIGRALADAAARDTSGFASHLCAMEPDAAAAAIIDTVPAFAPHAAALPVIVAALRDELHARQAPGPEPRPAAPRAARRTVTKRAHVAPATTNGATTPQEPAP